MQHTFKIGDREIMAVGVPADANLKLAKHVNGIDNKIMCIKDGKATYIDLPIGYYFEILLPYPGCSEIEAASLVEKTDNPYWYGNGFPYIDYTNTTNCFDNTIESLTSLMEREKLYVENPYGKHQPCWRDYNERDQFKISLDQWQETQQRVSPKWLLIELKK